MKRETILLMQKEIERAFKYFNKTLYDSLLPDAIITIQAGSSRNALGWYSPCRWAFKESGEHLDEINISAEALSSFANDGNSPEAIVTLLHEMVHLYNARVLKVIDIYENGHHRKKEFGQTAEQKGLICKYSDRYPGVTTPGINSDASLLLGKMKFRNELFNKFRKDELDIKAFGDLKIPGKKKADEGKFKEKLEKVYGKKKSVPKRKSLMCLKCRYSVSVAYGFSHSLKCMSCGSILEEKEN